jgi:HK97 family phage major capsid protein
METFTGMLSNPVAEIPDNNILEYLERNKNEVAQLLTHKDLIGIVSEINKRSKSIPKDIETVKNLPDVEIRGYMHEVDLIQNAKEIVKRYQEHRENIIQATLDGKGEELLTVSEPNQKDKNKMENLEIRSFQKYITEGTRNMNETEMRALDLSGSAAVLPVEIYSNLITSNKFADLLPRATVMNIANAGNVYVPIASASGAAWRTELDPGAELSPTLTKLELGGYELMRLLQISAAANSMASADFTNMLTELIGSEVIEELEKSFIAGTGLGQPKGLIAHTWDASNQKLTASAVTAIAPADIAAALALLPQKYARNAVLVMNADMFYKVGLFKATAEYGYDLASGATSFMGHQIIVNEHVANDTIYAVDPKQLYVRFANPMAIEVDRSAGFTSATIYLRSLCVVDAKWKPKGCVRLGLGA